MFVVATLILSICTANLYNALYKNPTWNQAAISESQAVAESGYNPAFMQEAISIAKSWESTNYGGPYGAVVVKDNKIIASASNHNIIDKSKMHHAEMNAINEACAILNTDRLNGCVLYSNAEPCLMCASAIANAKIDKVFYAVNFEDIKLYNSDEEYYITIHEGETLTSTYYVDVENKMDPFKNKAPLKH